MNSIEKRTNPTQERKEPSSIIKRSISEMICIKKQYYIL